VNQALREMREDGTYDEIYNKWFPEDESGKVE
jgi:putative glutamine transport system substrate-binding protein